MLQDQAISKAAQYYFLVGTKVRSIASWEPETIGRVTAYRIDATNWEVGIFFYPKTNADAAIAPNCTLDFFLTNYVEFKD